MTVEYMLLVILFVLFLAGSIKNGPYNAFQGGGPKLGARIEKHLITGDGFPQSPGVKEQWVDQ